MIQVESLRFQRSNLAFEANSDSTMAYPAEKEVFPIRSDGVQTYATQVAF